MDLTHRFTVPIGVEETWEHFGDLAALARAREILGLPPVVESLEPHEALHAEKRELETARRELSEVLERTNRALNRPKQPVTESVDERR